MTIETTQHPNPADGMLTAHARRRMHEMGVTEEMVRRTVRHYERRYEQTEQGIGRWCYQRSLLAVIVDLSRPERPVIVTVLWRDMTMWSMRNKVGYAR